jgi:hypothetical protein
MNFGGGGGRSLAPKAHESAGRRGKCTSRKDLSPDSPEAPSSRSVEAKPKGGQENREKAIPVNSTPDPGLICHK